MKKNNSVNLLLTGICILLVFLCGEVMQLKDNFVTSTILSILVLIVTLVVIKNRTGSYVSIASFFVLCSFLFHNAQQVLLLVGYPVSDYDTGRLYLQESIYNKACYFVLLTNLALLCGIVMKSNHTRPVITKRAPQKTDYRRIFKAGVIVFCITMPFRLYTDVSKLILSITAGYLNTFNVTYTGITYTIGQLADIAVVMMLVGKRDDKRFCSWTLIAAISYLLIMMFSGGRGEAVTKLLMYFLLYYLALRRKRVNIKTVVLGIFIVWFGVVFLESISDVRAGKASVAAFFEAFVDNMFFKPAIFDFLLQFGGTFKNVQFAINDFPPIGVSNGFNYLRAIVMVLPNIGGFVTEMIAPSIYTNFFSMQLWWGGSYIGELYYSCGNMGWLLGLVIGYFISALDIRLKTAKNREDWFSVITVFLVVAPLIGWIRGFFHDMIRPIVWGVIICWCAYKISAKPWRCGTQLKPSQDEQNGSKFL